MTLSYRRTARKPHHRTHYVTVSYRNQPSQCPPVFQLESGISLCHVWSWNLGLWYCNNRRPKATSKQISF